MIHIDKEGCKEFFYMVKGGYIRDMYKEGATLTLFLLGIEVTLVSILLSPIMCIMCFRIGKK